MGVTGGGVADGGVTCGRAISLGVTGSGRHRTYRTQQREHPVKPRRHQRVQSFTRPRATSSRFHYFFSLIFI